MNRSTRTLSQVLFACVFFVSLTSGLRAQYSTNTYGPPGQNWPDNPPVGIGTVGIGTPQNALQIHHDPGNSLTMPAILRLSDGATDTSNYFGALALMPDTSSAFYDTWSNLATQYDLVLHEHLGDMILANFNEWGGAIRLSTTPDHTTVPPGTLANDLERVTILQNGNVGINIPPVVGTPSLCAPLDQIQIGGGVQPALGATWPEPGLTIYGGNQFENLTLQNGKMAPMDRRYISFNHYIDHADTGFSRLHRFWPVASSEIDFSSENGGLLSFNTEPYDASRGLNSFSRTFTLEISGTYGLGCCVYDSAAAVQKHTLFEVNPPGIKLGAITRNPNGLFVHHTPVLITSDTASYPSIDFQNLPIRPNLGDDTTWDLVVNGAALFKEAFVNIDWPDYVFQPGYKIIPLSDVAKFIANNHHLPGVPSAAEMAKTGVPLGQTEATMMKKIEELTEYVIGDDKKIEALEKEVEGLKQEKGK